jgi:hypothetical protein
VQTEGNHGITRNCLSSRQGFKLSTSHVQALTITVSGNLHDEFQVNHVMRSKVIYDWQSVGQSVLVSGAHLGPVINFSFSLKFSLDSCELVILSRPLWREDGSVIYSTVASGPCQSSQSWVEVPQNSRPYFTVTFETPPTWRAWSPYLYPPGNRVAQLYPRALGSFFVTSYDSQGYGGGIVTRLHTGLLYSSCYVYASRWYRTLP